MSYKFRIQVQSHFVLHCITCKSDGLKNVTYNDAARVITLEKQNESWEMSPVVGWVMLGKGCGFPLQHLESSWSVSSKPELQDLIRNVPLLLFPNVDSDVMLRQRATTSHILMNALCQIWSLSSDSDWQTRYVFQLHSNSSELGILQHLHYLCIPCCVSSVYFHSTYQYASETKVCYFESGGDSSSRMNMTHCLKYSEMYWVQGLPPAKGFVWVIGKSLKWLIMRHRTPILQFLMLQISSGLCYVISLCSETLDLVVASSCFAVLYVYCVEVLMLLSHRLWPARQFHEEYDFVCL